MVSSATTTTESVAIDAKSGLPERDPYSRYYTNKWPAMPFHEGEILVQKETGDYGIALQYAPQIIRPYMPEQHRKFYESQPFIVASARDANGNMWATLLLSGTRELVTSPDPVTLEFKALPIKGDALEGQLQPGSDIGLLGIEFATKRRNRVNGRVQSIGDNSFTFRVDQSFGNCPQYIQPRKWWIEENKASTVGAATGATEFTTVLIPKQKKLIEESKTLFIASGYRGEGEDVRFGNDASHRGGPAGFVRVIDDNTLLMPDYSGNKSYMTFGNLRMDPRAGLTFVDYENGGLLQLTGTTEISTDPNLVQDFAGALRVVKFNITAINELPAGSLPVRWKIPESEQPREARISRIVQESADVKSFYLSPTDTSRSLWDFSAGNHLPIALRTPKGEVLRTYSLSGSPNEKEMYRISVKRHESGMASRFLHDDLKVGSTLSIRKPAGEFVLDKNDDKSPVVLLSAGIGVTPVLNMLHDLVESGSQQKIYWIHGARDGQHHALREEVEELISGKKNIVSKILYSKPLLEDGGKYDMTGRIGARMLEEVLGDDFLDGVYYLCGPLSMIGDLEVDLNGRGVDSKRVRYETF